MLRRLIQGAIALPCAVLLASTANAVPIAFQISSGSATASGFAIGSTVSITPDSDITTPFVLDLDGGPTSHTFDFLNIEVAGQGLVAGTVQASLNFADPVVGSATGLLVGLAIVLDSFAGGTVAVLSNPGPIAFGDGGLFGVTFDGFSTQCYSCRALSGTVTATVSLLSAPRGVPEPATLSLLGAGLAAFAFARRRRKA